jgi:hypothetical protein
MDIHEIEKIEAEENVSFSLNDAGRIAVKGPAGGVDRALGRIATWRDEAAVLLRKRQGLPDPDAAIITREIAANVAPLAVQRAKYIDFFSARGDYFTPSAEELDRMFSVLEEGDEVLPDFAFSFSVRRRDGRLVQVDRKGRITAPSIYSPAVKGVER